MIHGMDFISVLMLCMGLDLNLGVGYVHFQYDKYKLGGEYANFPLEVKKTKQWIGPTKFGVSLTYNIFR